jgi:tetratricopeptide (TPR) repeat protein
MLFPARPLCFWISARRVWALLFLLLGLAWPGRAGELTFTNYLAQGELAEQRGDVAGALKFYTAADTLSITNCAELCLLTRRYCDLMHLATNRQDTQKILAERALAAAQRAVMTDSNSATAHLCVAVGYVKNFPYADNATRVKWSKAIKSACETAIALDPKQDVSYYLLGRWHVGVADMNIFVKGIVKIVYGGLPKASRAEAIGYFQKAIALAPDRIIHHLELAKVYAETGQEKLARAELETCRNLQPRDRDDTEAKQEALALLADRK